MLMERKTLGILCLTWIVSKRTQAQHKFEFPYVLVRDDAEVEAFFTPTFAPALRFARDSYPLRRQWYREEYDRPLHPATYLMARY
jgi:hypothetical protein